MTDAHEKYEPTEHGVKHVLRTLALPLDEFNREAARQALLARNGDLWAAAEFLAHRLKFRERP